jgi:hypothetical protein
MPAETAGEKPVLNDFVVNIVAGVALLVAGFVSRRMLSRLRTEATRRLWRASVAEGLTIALTSRRGSAPRSGGRASLEEVRALLQLVPTLSQLNIRYTVIASFIRTASQITNKNILLFGGPDANELTRALLELLTPRVIIEADDHPSFTVFGRRYEPRYSAGKSTVIETYGLVMRTPNPFSSNPHLTATLVMGLHGLGTGGAARLLVDESLLRNLISRLSQIDFVAIVRVRPVGDEYAVKLEVVQEL